MSEPNDTNIEEIIPKDSKLEVIYNDAHFTEGPTVAPDNTVYFSDITFTHQTDMQAGHIMKYDSKTDETTVFRSPSGMSNGMKFDAQGRLVIAEGADFGGRRIIRTDMKTGKSEIIAALYEGKALNSPNDLTIDEQGRIYFTDPRYVGHESVEQPVMGVYRIDTDGTVDLVIADSGKPNGIAVSPDQKTLYVGSNDSGTFREMPENMPTYTGRMALLAYDLTADGSVTSRETLVDYAPEHGPDGFEVDVEGNLYVAVRDKTRFGVCVYTPNGKELAYIKTPELPTNVAFGRGDSSKVLYITAGGGLYRIRVSKDGYHLPQK